MVNTSSLSHCAAMVKTHDPDSYLCTLFAPASVREDWFAIIAFHCEIAHLTSVVHEEMIGFIRLAWWKEAIEAIYARNLTHNHPTLQALLTTIQTYNIPQSYFTTLLEAYEARIAKPEFETTEEIVLFNASTSIVVLQACARCLGIIESKEVHHFAEAFAYSRELRKQSSHPERYQALLTLTKQSLAACNSSVLLPPEFKAFYKCAEFYFKRARLKHLAPLTPFERLKLTLKLWLS